MEVHSGEDFCFVSLIDVVVWAFCFFFAFISLTLTGESFPNLRFISALELFV